MGCAVGAEVGVVEAAVENNSWYTLAGREACLEAVLKVSPCRATPLEAASAHTWVSCHVVGSSPPLAWTVGRAWLPNLLRLTSLGTRGGYVDTIAD